MAGSLKDQLEKAGVVEKPPAPKPQDRKKWREELPDDERPLPQFEAPALTKPVDPPKPPKVPKPPGSQGGLRPPRSPRR